MSTDSHRACLAVGVKAAMMGGYRTGALHEQLNKRGKPGGELANVVCAAPTASSPTGIFKKEQ